MEMALSLKTAKKDILVDIINIAQAITVKQVAELNTFINKMRKTNLKIIGIRKCQNQIIRI
jgi:hypothetical protein